MNITDIVNAIDAIKALPICELDKRQGMLIDLLVEMVNSETCDGEITELNQALEERIAAHWFQADRMAIANGLPLNIDKQLDAMLMG
ncbi:protein kinase [Yersinia phage YpP-R]|uniref:Protein kinase n=1 Tax=Yersinia phage YpP-R TaxID=1176765 RepID=I6Q9P7_9CAUD|nr:protein kinase [Yersinia phage YpP-R]